MAPEDDPADDALADREEYERWERERHEQESCGNLPAFLDDSDYASKDA